MNLFVKRYEEIRIFSLAIFHLFPFRGFFTLYYRILVSIILLSHAAFLLTNNIYIIMYIIYDHNHLALILCLNIHKDELSWNYIYMWIIIPESLHNRQSVVFALTGQYGNLVCAHFLWIASLSSNSYFCWQFKAILIFIIISDLLLV